MAGTLAAAQTKHQAHARMPAFDLLLAKCPRDRSGGNVKRLIGGGVNDTGKPLKDQWLGGRGYLSLQVFTDCGLHEAAMGFIMPLQFRKCGCS